MGKSEMGKHKSTHSTQTNEFGNGITAISIDLGSHHVRGSERWLNGLLGFEYKWNAWRWEL